MNPNMMVFAAAKINGSVTQWNKVELKKVPMMLGRLILETEIDTSHFSSLELRISKRPVKFDQSESLDIFKGIEIPIMQDHDPIDDIGDISHKELQQLYNDSTWTQYMQYIRAPENFPTHEAELLKANFNSSYHGSKFMRLITSR